MTPSLGHGARYSAWTGTQSVPTLGADDVLNALSDNLLTDGIDPTVTKALHQGIPGDDEQQTPGLDQLRDRLRSEQRSVMSAMTAEMDEQALSEAATSTGDDSLQRLLNALRANAPAFPAMLDSASPGVRAELEDILQSASPSEMSTPIAEMVERLVDLSRLEQNVRSVRTVEQIDKIDLDALEGLLGQDASDNLSKLARSLRGFSESGYVQRAGSRSVLSARAVQKIGDALLHATLGQVDGRSAGEHMRRDRGQSHDLAGTARDYEFGDPFDLDLSQTVLAAVKRQHGTPVGLTARDLKVLDRESSERATTILAIDLSRSMGERGYLLAAKRLALALSTFIRRRYPHDELLLVGFSESARVLKLQELVELQWDRYGFGTNVHDALRLSNGILAAHRGRRRHVVLLTDGEPTAFRDPGGEVQFSHPPSEETVARTYRQARQLRRDGIYLCICLLSATSQVARFGEELARHSAGDLIVTEPENLNADLFVTYNRRRG